MSQIDSLVNDKVQYRSVVDKNTQTTTFYGTISFGAKITVPENPPYPFKIDRPDFFNHYIKETLKKEMYGELMYCLDHLRYVAERCLYFDNERYEINKIYEKMEQIVNLENKKYVPYSYNYPKFTSI